MRDPKKPFMPPMAEQSDRANSSVERIVKATREVLANLLETLPESMTGWEFDTIGGMDLVVMRTITGRALLDGARCVCFCACGEECIAEKQTPAQVDDWARMATAMTQHNLIAEFTSAVRSHADHTSALADAIEALLR